MNDLDRRARELVGKAREYMEEHGWCQNTSEDDDGRVCILGALGRAMDEGRVTSASLRRARQLIAKHLMGNPFSTHRIPMWNDEPERTGEDVLLMMKKVESGE